MKRYEFKRAGFGIALFISIFIFVLPCWGETPERMVMNTKIPQKITLTTGKSIIVENPEAVARVSVASPDIAGVLVLTPWQIYITGKSPGITNVTIWKSKNGDFIRVLDIEVLPDVTRLKEKLHEVFPMEKDIKVNVAHESITVSGTVSNAALVPLVLDLARAYAPQDKEGKPRISNFLEVAGVQQVMLEVRVSEIARSTIKNLGINWSYVSDSGRQFGISLLDNLSKFPSAGFPSNPLTISDNINLAFRFLGAGATWTVLIDALKENGLSKVLAEPTLITLSGKTANFLAGGEFPIPVPQASGVSTTITVDYKPFGVGLKFTPTVLGNGKISMQVAPEVSELDFSQSIVIQGFVIPSITTRRVSTTIELSDGQSFAIAGLLNDQVKETVRKFPVLGDIPVLGALFRSSAFQKNETELVIVVTPHMVKPLDLKKQPLPTDQYIEPDDFEFYLLGATEGRDKGDKYRPGSPPSSLLPLGKSGGLEGGFGHISIQ